MQASAATSVARSRSRAPLRRWKDDECTRSPTSLSEEPALSGGLASSDVPSKKPLRVAQESQPLSVRVLEKVFHAQNVAMCCQRRVLPSSTASGHSFAR